MWLLGAGSGWGVGCAGEPAPSRALNAPPREEEALAVVEVLQATAPLEASAPLEATASPGVEEKGASPEQPPTASCPAGMAHVVTSFCPDVKRQCLKKEDDPSNRITICHRFAEGKTDCRAPRVPLDYCIDEYEFPNQAGVKPQVMASFYGAEKACADLGKRVCREAEWVAACEGPEETPFPTGWRREPEKCNFDNKWVSPILDRVYAKDAEVQRAELERLDRSAPSGARPGCKSGFGVLDLTGNVDEWVRADVERQNRRSRFAGLKGGAWGHVRNACRPVTTSHPPDFTYYFIGFRCCADSSG